MKIFGLLTFLIISTLTLSAWKQGEPVVYENHKFEAMVGKILIENQLLEQGKKVDDIVSAEVPAVLFTPAIEIDSKAPISTGIEEVDFFSGYLNANVKGTKEDMLTFWEEPARAEKKAMFDDDAMFQKNREFALNNTSHKIAGLVKQGDTVDVLWEYMNGGIIGVPMKKIDDKWQLLASSPNDLELAIIEASFSSKGLQ